MRKARIGWVALSGSLCALAVAGASTVQRAGADPAPAAATPIYLDTTYSFQERAADLVSRMTLQEKASQMVSSASPAIPRLGIPQYGWWNEALHGVSRSQTGANGNATTLTNTTSYPIDQSLGSTWNPDLIYRVSSQIGDEAREVSTNNTENLDFYSPTMNLERDPRWGRNDESYGEDPLLVNKEVDQFVNGMEGKDESGTLLPEAGGYHKTITTIKHYAANNSEVNRRTGSSDMDDRTLREYYTKAFRGVVQDSQPGSVMSSYNSINGVPTATDPYLMDNLMRQTFGFQGYFTSDCDATFEIVGGHHWQPPSWTRPLNNIERNAFAISTGEDLDCNAGYKDGYNYLDSAPVASNSAIQTQMDTFNVNDMDASLVRLFTARMETGEFDAATSVPWVAKARAAVAAGTWVNSNANNAVTVTQPRLDLAREAADKSIVLLKNSGNLLPLKPPTSGAYKVLVLGYFANPGSVYLGGYSASEGAAGTAKIINGYNGLKNAITAIDPQATVDYMKGFTGTGTTAAALTAVDPAAVAAAANYDAVIVYAGTDAGTATEDIDRTAVTLPGAQGSLISQVEAANPKTIVYMETIGPVDVRPFEPTTSALLWSSYNGMRKGDALADVVLGKYNPSARTPSIWVSNIADLPATTDYTIRPTAAGGKGRTYQYFTGPVSYPFGYGLSYTTFSTSNLVIDKKTPTADDSFTASVDVKNTGATAGTDTVELYVTTPDAPASAERPVKRLEGFSQVTLDAGQTKTVQIKVNVPDLAFSSGGKWVVDDGRYGIQVAQSSADGDIAAQDTITVSGAITPKPSVVTVKPVIKDSDVSRDIAQRVEFPIGATIDPQATVAMNDDSLVGYVSKGKPVAYPSGMTFSYASNHPDVVSVSGSTIKTLANGVATVTVDATYHGVTKTTTFVVRVVAQLGGITVNGQPLTGFSPDRYSYDVVLADGAAIPTVAGTSGDPSATVAVTQATAVPGAATVVATGADGTPFTYTINFANTAKSDEFNGSAPGSQWSFVRQNAATESEANGAFTIQPEAGDLNTTTNTAKNLLLQPVVGDWTMESKLNFSVLPHVATQQGGIIVYQDDNNYLKLDLEFTGGSAQIVETQEDFSFNPFTGYTVPIATVLGQVSTTGLGITGGNVWLKMIKTGQRYKAYYSVDGSTWTFLYDEGDALSNAKVGVFAYNRTGTSTDLKVGFDYFRIATSATATAPVGGTVPATLALTLGAPASFGTFTPGIAKDYSAATTADIVSTAGDATLSVSDPGHLTNGAFSLPSALGVTITPSTWSAPISHGSSTITFNQHIGANDALRTGGYSTTLTFTLSTTTP
jgi:beta-glucosidase